MARPPLKPKVLISSSQKALRVPRKKLTELAAFVARAEGRSLAQIDLAVVADRRIAALNRSYLGHAGSTDVLSFDLSDSRTPGICGQLIVCGDLAVREARRRGCSPQRELMLYVVHGLLHLMGYDDTSIRAAAKMHARQDELLRQFLARPRRKPGKRPRAPR